MDQFIDVTQSKDELARIFFQLGLAKEGETPVATRLTGGVSSNIFRVDVSTGSYCLKQALPQLKVEKEWKVPVDRVFAEIDWLQTADGIVPGHVPKVLGKDENTKSFVMEFLAAGHAVWKSELLNGRVDVEIARQVGDIIGAIHAATAHSADCAKRFAHDGNFYAIRLEPYLAETGRTHPVFQSRMDLLIERTKRNTIALVHGDLSPKNILVGPNGPVILDAECAWYGDPAFDVAFCLNHLLIKAAWLPQHLETLLDSFAAFAEAYFRRVNFEDHAGLEERIATLLPALTLARIDGKSPVEYLAADARDPIRQGAIRLLNKDYSRLADVSAQWKLDFSK
jgi:aminoglycoside phosphotransferase (APT) family kinase protein